MTTADDGTASSAATTLRYYRSTDGTIPSSNTSATSPESAPQPPRICNISTRPPRFLPKSLLNLSRRHDIFTGEILEKRHIAETRWQTTTSNPNTRPTTRSIDTGTVRLDGTASNVFWLRDESLTDLDSLPEPHEFTEEIIENLEAGLESFRYVLAGLGSR